MISQETQFIWLPNNKSISPIKLKTSNKVLNVPKNVAKQPLKKNPHNKEQS